MTEQDEPNEVTSEEAEIFKNLVFSPEAEKKPYHSTHTVSTIHSGNILCVVPWEQNSNYIFSTDVTKRLVCFSLDDLSVVSEASVSAPCCSLVLVRDSKYLLAGCMDGRVHIFQIESANHVVTKLTVDSWRGLPTLEISREEAAREGDSSLQEERKTEHRVEHELRQHGGSVGYKRRWDSGRGCSLLLQIHGGRDRDRSFAPYDHFSGAKPAVFDVHRLDDAGEEGSEHQSARMGPACVLLHHRHRADERRAIRGGAHGQKQRHRVSLRAKRARAELVRGLDALGFVLHGLDFAGRSRAERDFDVLGPHDPRAVALLREGSRRAARPQQAGSQHVLPQRPPSAALQLLLRPHHPRLDAMSASLFHKHATAKSNSSPPRPSSPPR